MIFYCQLNLFAPYNVYLFQNATKTNLCDIYAPKKKRKEKKKKKRKKLNMLHENLYNCLLFVE